MTDHEEEIFDVDFSEITELEEQISYCEKMLKILDLEESLLRKQFMGAQTLTDLIDTDLKIKAEVGEYLGYNYGTINQSMNLVDNAVLNLKKFAEGNLNDIDPAARGMFISIWYNLAAEQLATVTNIMGELEGLEHDLVGRLASAADDDTIEIQRRVIH